MAGALHHLAGGRIIRSLLWILILTLTPPRTLPPAHPPARAPSRLAQVLFIVLTLTLTLNLDPDPDPDPDPDHGPIWQVVFILRLTRPIGRFRHYI